MTKQSIQEEVAKAMKQFHLTPEATGLSYDELCIHPNLDLPEGFKVPKFDTFEGNGNPLAHLRTYCDQLVGVGKNEALLMRLFSRSLSGEALEWFTSQDMRQWPNWSAMAKDFVERFAYNVEIVPDRYSLERIKQRSNESYREYAYRWRKEAARVRPPMNEKEIVEVFVRVQESEFYDRMMLLIGAKFAEIVKVGETIEDGLRTGRIARMTTSAGSSGLPRKKREDVSSISCASEGKRSSSSNSKKSMPPRTYPQSPQNTFPVYYSQPAHPASQPNYQIPSPNFPSPQYQNIYQTPMPNCSNIQPTYQASPPSFSTPPYQNTPPNYRAPSPNYHTPPYPRFQTPTPPL